MGMAISHLCEHNDEYSVVAGCDAFDNSEMNYPVYQNPADCTEDFDVIIDFSNAMCVPTILNYAVTVKKPFICCTTGLSDETVSEILKSAEKIAVFKSANMSLGVNVMIELIKQAARTLYPDFDIEILEAHHNRKVDAPSGTAMMLATAIQQEVPDQMEYVYDRHSRNEARSKNEIGISSIRGGNIAGEHSVFFISDEETITISHSAKSRDVFAMGALKAAGFMAGKTTGYFTMSDVISESVSK
jgi:4-hydroxy-tetrahydrodipicolinate reductase